MNWTQGKRDLVWNFVTANPSSIPVTLPSSNEESFPRVFSKTVISFPHSRSLILVEVFSILSSIFEWYLCWDNKVHWHCNMTSKRSSYPINPIDSTQLHRLIFGVEHNIDHGANLWRQDVGCRIKKDSFVQLTLKCSKCPENIDLLKVKYWYI